MRYGIVMSSTRVAYCDARRTNLAAPYLQYVRTYGLLAHFPVSPLTCVDVLSSAYISVYFAVDCTNTFSKARPEEALPNARHPVPAMGEAARVDLYKI